MSQSQEPPRSQAVRNLTVLTRKEGVSREEFSRYWRDVHAPLVSRLPHILRYSQHHILASATRAGYTSADYEIDGIVDFTFDSAEGMAKAWEGELARRTMDDARTFIEKMRVYTVQEHVIVNRAPRP